MHQDPEHVVRAFAAASNLVVSGQPTAIMSNDPDAIEPLRRLLRELGAVLVSPEEAHYLYLDGDSGLTLSAEDLEGGGFRDDLILVEAGAREAFVSVGATERATREPFRAYTVSPSRTVQWLSAQPSTTFADAASRLTWARDHMPACAAAAVELAQAGLVRGTRIGISMVLEPKTATLALFLREAGAEVVLYAHADETDPDIAEVLRREGFTVHASVDEREQLRNARAFLAENLSLLLDDGSHLIRLAALEGVSLDGAAEETTSGLHGLREMGTHLRIPVLAVNDARMKTRFDNRYGTGQSCVFAIADLLDRVDRRFSGSTTAVIGFGPVGEGVAQHAKALGAEVTVVEQDPVRALEAAHAGYRTRSLADAITVADIVISATGREQTVPLWALQAAAAAGTNAVFAVAGGVVDEIELSAAQRAGAELSAVAPKIDALRFTDGEVLILDRGGCINITAAEGNPVQIMDYSFAVQLSAVGLLASGQVRGAGLHPIPDIVDARIASSLLPNTQFAPEERTEESSGWMPTRFLELRTEQDPTA